MPSLTQFAFGSAFRGRAILARAAQLIVIGTIALGACDRALAPTAVVSGGSEVNSSATPGTLSAPFTPTLPPPPTALHNEATYSGKFVLSLDAAGYTSTCGTVSVQKPVGATVQQAFMAAATTPGTQTINNTGDITLNGTNVAFTESVPAGISGTNYWGEVTTIVKPVVDPAAAGIVDFSVCENNNKSSTIEGEILAVVFNDPSLTRNNTIVLLFGTQQPTGDDFAISLANPIDKTDPALVLDMSLGISFGFQPSSQFSTVDVNGSRMTSSAGGQDDGQPSNGALITVGGIGDTDANPADPNANANDPRYDDELYSLLPFVANGASNIAVHTSNPSNDDNIFFAAFFMNVAGNVNCESTPPAISVANVIAGPPKQVLFSVQDNGSGLQSINVNTSTNANTVVDPFVPGTTSAVTVTATKIDQSQPSIISLTASDVCQNSTLFDPFDVSLGAAKGIQALTETSRSVTATGISDVEHFVMIQNGNPGVKSVTVTVNGKKFEIADLKNGELRRGIDIGSAMTKGEPNTVQFRSKGKLGAGAIAVLYE